MPATSALSQRAEASPGDTRSAAAAFGVLAATQFALILAIGMLTLALPAAARDLRLSQASLAFLSASYSSSFAGLLLLGGRLAGRLGRRRAFLWGTVMFAAMSALGGLAPDFAVLVGARLAQGAAAALCAPAGMALVQSVFPGQGRRTGAVAAWGGISSAGATVGTLTGGIAAISSWRLVFAVPAVIAMATALAGRRLLPAGPQPEPARLDVAGAVTAATGLGALIYGLISTLSAGWASPGVVAPLAAGSVLLAGFAVAETRAASPLLPLRFLLSARRATGLLAVFLSAGGAATVGFFISLYLQQIRGWSGAAASLAFAPYLLTLPVSLLAARLLSRAGAGRLTVTGLLIAAAGLALLGRLGLHTGYPTLILPGLALFAIGTGCSFAGAMVAAMDHSGDEPAALAAGVANTAMEAGPTAGLAILVSVAATRGGALASGGSLLPAATAGGYAFALSAGAVLFVLAALLAARTLRPRA
jgi:MFS family permease